MTISAQPLSDHKSSYAGKHVSWGSLTARYAIGGKWMAWFGLALLLLGTAAAAHFYAKQVESTAEQSFERQISEARDRFRGQVAFYENALRSGVALFASADHRPSRAEWTGFVEKLSANEKPPGFVGMGFVEMLTPSEVPLAEARLRAEGFANFRVSPAGNRGTYSVIAYIAPLESSSRRAMGYDMYSDPTRREAMDRARDTGALSVSGKLALKQAGADSGKTGILAFMPVYASSTTPDTLAEKRQSLRGFVYIALKPSELLTWIRSENPEAIDLKIYDGNIHDERGLLASTQSAATDLQVRSQIALPMQIGGRQWQAVFTRTREVHEVTGATLAETISVTSALAALAVLMLTLPSVRPLRQQGKTSHAPETALLQLQHAQDRLEKTRVITGVGLIEVMRNDETVRIDSIARNLMDIPSSGLIPLKTLLDRVHSDDRERLSRALLSPPQNADSLSVRFRIQRTDDRSVYIEAQALDTNLRVESDSALALVVKDVTHETVRGAENQIIATALANIRDGLMITDARSVIVDVNQAFCDITGYSKEQLIGKTPRILKSNEQDRYFYREFWRQLRVEGYFEGEFWNTARDGTTFVVYERVSAIRSSEGEITHFVAVVTDVTENLENKSRLESIALIDHLTGLPNRAQLHETLRSEIVNAHTHGHALAVCYIDLDNFQSVNDRLGHGIGDELLILVSGKLKTLIRPGDWLARIGGDEFAVVLTNMLDYASCEEYAEKILAGIRNTYTLSDDHKVYVTASIGVTLYPKEDSDADRLLRHADQAMYQAKDRGGDRCELFDIEKSNTENSRQRKIKRIEYALRDQEFVLHFQPKVNMRTGLVIGAEALIRWQHPDDGLIGPNEFLPLVAGTDQAVDIDKWVIAEALQQIIRFKKCGLELPVSVNIDGSFLQSPGFVNYLKSQLRANPEVAPSMLELEILESTALIDLDNVRRVIETCQSLGVTVALDDFGTGYSSLTYLKTFPCNTLKIDKSFIIDMLKESESRSLVEGVIGLARAFNRRVVAEGVETEEHGQMLLSMGCEYGQGYGIQRPVSADALVEWIQSYSHPEQWKNVTDNVYWLDHYAGRSVSTPPSTPA